MIDNKTITPYLQLMRLDKPIGIYLLLWPTLWALWIAGAGKPQALLVVVFTVGVLLMRSAGCVINDFADRELDKFVSRTQHRPITAGEISPFAALVCFALLCYVAFVLVVVFTNRLTVYLSIAAVLLATLYPFMKRVTHLPQIVLGMAFACSIPMAFAAQTNAVTSHTFLLYVAAVLWTVAYDTQYAMVDREEDLKIGIKSTAILFGDLDVIIISALQILFLLAMALVGQQLAMNAYYFAALGIAAILFVYQYWLIHQRDPARCLQAFLHNHWVGLVLFIGVVLNFLP